MCSSLIRAYSLLGTCSTLVQVLLSTEVIFWKLCNFQILQSGEGYNSKRSALPTRGMLYKTKYTLLLDTVEIQLHVPNNE